MYWGLGLQFAFAFLVLRFSYGQAFMSSAGQVVQNMLAATTAGTKILFGELGLPNAGAFGDVLAKNGHPNAGSIFAFQELFADNYLYLHLLRPALLYHIGLMQLIIKALAWIDAEDDAHLGRGKHERRGLDLHGAD